jgi:hypothetical protein
MYLAALLFEISRRGITLTCGRTEDRLNAKPTAALTPELIKKIKQHKKEIIQILREDEEMRRAGIIRSERQVFDLAREFFGADNRGGTT